MLQKIATAAALSVLAACLYAQGLTTSARPTDWEEINFEFNSSVLSDGYPSLLRLAELLGQHPDYRVRVIGHTDYVGSTGYNQKLAQARANTVRDFLVKYGASAGQVTTVSEGKTNPAYTNRSKEGRFMNRRVTLSVTDGQGRVVGEGGMSDIMNALQEFMKKQEECCSNILKRLDKLDEILAALRDLKGENDRLKSELADQRNALGALQKQVSGLPRPLSEQQTASIAQAEGKRVLDEMQARNKKFSLLSLNAGPTFGDNKTGDYTISGRGQFFSPFGGSGRHAVQAQAEYMYYTGRQEGQFDIGLVNRINRFQAGLFSSFKYLNFREFQSGGGLVQASFTGDYLFSRGRVGVFATKGIKNTAVLNRAQLGPNSFLETYARLMNQGGVSALVGLHNDAWVEGNLAYLQSHGQADRPGGMLRFVQPFSDQFAFTAEVGWNETFVNPKQSGRVVFGLQFGNFIRPKEYASTNTPVPVDVPRIRYELLTRQVGNSAPVADAGPDQIGVSAGTITLDGSGSYDPDGQPLTYQWSQVAGPAVSISGMNSAQATFTAAEGQSYSFRLTVRDAGGLIGTARVNVSTLAAPAVRILNFSAEPNVIAPGGRARLTWSVANAEEVTITPGPGRVDSQSGSIDVTPSETTTYRLTARARGVEIAAPVTVTVSPTAAAVPGIIRFEATPTNIQPGESSTLSWTTANGAEVEISGIGRVEPNGSRVVTPSQSTTYTLTVRGGDGRTVTAPVIVTVGAGISVRVVSFAASPASIGIGASSQLCWNVEGATNISIEPGVGADLRNNDCVSVSPTQTTTYTLTAVGPEGRTVRASTVLLVGGVRITSFVSDPHTSDAAGAPVTLNWSTEGATYVILTGNLAPTEQLPPQGSVVVRPITNSTYTLTAFGPAGQVTSVLYVFVR